MKSAMTWLWLLVSLPLLAAGPLSAQEESLPLEGSVERGRLVFGPCRTCHYPEAEVMHNNGPSLHQIFGRVAGKQRGFRFYSDTFKAAQFVWTPGFMYNWLEAPMSMYPGSSMMSLGVPDPQARADLIAYLLQASAAQASGNPAGTVLPLDDN